MRTAKALLLAMALAACAGPAYYLQAVQGHVRLMRSAQEIEAYLEHAPDSDPRAARLLVAQDILRFAAAELDLPAGDSYREVAVTGRNAVVWNVVAAPEFSLRPRRWCFPVAGCVPYRGYFDETDAHRTAARLERRGYDVSVSGAIAYSSLGWFDDPIPDSMLSLTDARLAGTLFHELAHQRLYVKGDTEFNESYATFVEYEGVRQWLQLGGRENEAQRWQAYRLAADQFQALLTRTRGALERVYASGRPAGQMRAMKRAAFDDLRRQHDALADSAWRGERWFAGWFDPPPNNAALALAQSYHGGLCAFRSLYDTSGGDFAIFHRLAGRQAALGARQRAAWLHAHCG